MTAAEVAALDSAAADLGVGIVQLMEAAGIQVARLGWRMIGRRPRPVHVVAGRGHNGGDGLVAARHLASWGCAVTATVHADPASLSDLIEMQCRAARGAGVDLQVSDHHAGATALAPSPALVVDALLGTGFRGRLRPHLAAVIRALTGPILSVDVPSGMDADDGSVTDLAVRATATCVLAAIKRGFWEAGAAVHTGEMYVADIGLPAAAWTRCGLLPPTATRGGLLRRVHAPR